MSRFIIYCLYGTVLSASLPVAAQGINNSLAPIKQAQESDPAGFSLMIISIGLLVMMVLGLFGGTLFYMSQDKKAKQARANKVSQASEQVSSEQE